MNDPEYQPRATPVESEGFSGERLPAEPVNQYIQTEKPTFWAAGKDVLGIMADTSIAEHHPRTLQKPEEGAGRALKLMHAFHVAANMSGRLVERHRERKTRAWPLPASGPDAIKVLGYGAERVAYNVRLDDGRDMVLSVYHREALRRDPHVLALAKKRNYDTYRHYFGDLVVPTLFLEVDNPWGEGKKPATLQERFGITEELGDFTIEQLSERAAQDPQFGQALRKLSAGYKAMMADGHCPDVASSNVLISGSDILLPDTGRLFKAERAKRLKSIHGTYDIIESLVSP